MRLLITLNPEREESFISYIVRLTEANGYETPSWIFSLSGIDYMELQWKFTFVFSRSEKLTNLAKLTGSTLDDLLSLLYIPAKSQSHYEDNHEYDFFGALLNRSIIRPHCPKVCPKCLAASGYSLRIWDCSLVTACPIHECMLLDTCPACNRRIKCVRNKLCICSCGFDWRETNLTTIPEGQLALSRRIYQLCGALPREKLANECESPLRGLGLQDFTIVMVFIAGLFGKLAWATGRPSRSIKLRNTQLHTLFTKAHKVFENWPHNFHQFVEVQSKGKKRFNPHGGELHTALKREFGSFYGRLYEDLPGHQFDFMREAFAQFLTNRVKSQSEPSVIPSCGAAKYISVVQARRLLKITHRTMFDLIKIGKIDFVIRNEGTAMQYLLRLSDVEDLKCKFEQSVSSRILAKELGVDCEVVRELGRAGILKTRWRPAVDGYHTTKFDRHSAQELLNRLSSLSMKAYEPDDGYEILDFSTASKLCESLGVTVAVFVKAIADGEVRPCAVIENPGLGRFLFTRATLARYCSKTTARSYSNSQSRPSTEP
jgi:muconolactone delta-isomerase